MSLKMRRLRRHSIYIDKVLTCLVEIKELQISNLSMNHVQNNMQSFNIGELLMPFSVIFSMVIFMKHPSYL